MNLERPLCAVCKAPVTRFSWYDEMFEGARVFVVSCHGQQESVRVSLRVLISAREYWFGAAFEDEAKRRGMVQQ